MGAFTRSFGRPLSILIVALTVAWIFGLILLPQISMISRAFLVEDRSGVSAQLAVEIDKAYLDRFAVNRELGRLKAPAAAPTAPTPTPGVPPAAVTPSVTTPSVSTPSPSTPSVSTPSPSVATPSFGAPSPSAAPAADPAADAARIVELEAELAAIDARIAELEAQESGPRAVDQVLSVGNFTSMSEIHFRIFLSTLAYAVAVTALALVVCYPIAYAVAMAPTAGRASLLLLCLVIPYAINELLRIFAWVMILEKQGLINSVLHLIGAIDFAAGDGVRWVASNGAVFAVMVYTYVLFMVFPIYNTIDTLDRNQIEAARDLGASTLRIHARVVVPHAKPGIAVGSIMTFMLSAGSIAVPEIVGRGMHPDWFSQVIYRRFFEADSWNQGAAYSLALLVACMVFIMGVMAVFRVGIRDIAK